MKRLFVLLLALSLLLCACKKQSEYETEPETQPSTAAPETEPAETEPEETEPVYLYHHPLTGEPLETPLTARPVGVVINNIAEAQPLHGVGQADIIFETTAEGGGSITRLIGIFTELGEVEKVGSIRSARTYFDSIARSFSAPLVHCGGSDYALNELAINGQPHIDARFYEGTYFYRDAERKAMGYAQEHTLFAKGASLMNLLDEKGIATTVEPDTQYGLTFEKDVKPEGETANHISFRFSAGGKYTIMDYDQAAGCYHGTQKFVNGKERSFADANTAEYVDFENVIIIYTRITSDGYRVFAKLDGEGDGYFAANGSITPIRWHRADDGNANFTYTYPDGTPVTLSIGKTYVGILNTGLPVDFS